VGVWITLLSSIRPRPSCFYQWEPVRNSQHTHTHTKQQQLNSMVDFLSFTLSMSISPSYFDHTASTTVTQYTHLQSQRFIFYSPWAVNHHTTIHTRTTDMRMCILAHMQAILHQWYSFVQLVRCWRRCPLEQLKSFWRTWEHQSKKDNLNTLFW